VKRFLEITLGILTAIGGFVDIGDLVANAETGARSVSVSPWVVVVGVIGIIVFAEMSGRVAAVTGRAVFDLIRERLGARVALANLLASFFINFLTVTAEVAGVALALELATSVNYLLWIRWSRARVARDLAREVRDDGADLRAARPRARGVRRRRVAAPSGLGRVALRAAHPHVPGSESLPTYWYFAIALFGAAMTPYEVFFFSSGAVEEHWTRAT
jgi:Mn2+/Fe2+ NRAMP family transporter